VLGNPYISPHPEDFQQRSANSKDSSGSVSPWRAAGLSCSIGAAFGGVIGGYLMMAPTKLYFLWSIAPDRWQIAHLAQIAGYFVVGAFLGGAAGTWLASTIYGRVSEMLSRKRSSGGQRRAG
jgi:hypothetical protein